MAVLNFILVERGVEKHVELDDLSSSDVAASVARILSVS
jgi:NADH dehydrogenase (ubiquinone) 1 alpha subcomplex subunit 2